LIHPDLPLVELHRHLDGSIRLQTILDLGIQHGLPLPSFDLEGLRPYVQVTTPQPGVMAFIAKFKWMTGVLADYDAVRRIAYENVEDLKTEGLDYAELRFSPLFMAEPHNLDPVGVVEAVLDGISAGVREYGVPVKLIGILSRTYGPDRAGEELDALLSQADRITALDLAGDELNYPPEWFSRHFSRARDAGWHITVHAGESAGASSIWQAIRLLGAQRIGHAIHAVDDPLLLDHLASRLIGVESCLTSNVQTSCVPDYPSHPLKVFLDHGILATINTDDPGISSISLPYEYNIAAPQASLTSIQIRQAQKNALECAFLTQAERDQLISRHQVHKS
jgi:adenosine deaminase